MASGPFPGRPHISWKAFSHLTGPHLLSPTHLSLDFVTSIFWLPAFLKLFQAYFWVWQTAWSNCKSGKLLQKERDFRLWQTQKEHSTVTKWTWYCCTILELPVLHQTGFSSFVPDRSFSDTAKAVFLSNLITHFINFSVTFGNILDIWSHLQD